MGSFFRQFSTVVLMNLRSLPRRLWMSLAMVLASAVVVAILLAFLAMDRGFSATMTGAGSDRVAIFMRDGSASEINSVVTRDQLNLLAEAPGVARNSEGQALVSGELYVIVDGIKKSTQKEANIPLRGIGARGPELRPTFQLTQGRMFTPGTNELIVGESILREFDGFDLGDTMRFGKNEWTVVGAFSTGGNVFESELWADAQLLQTLYNRGSSYQSIRAVLATPRDIAPLEQAVADDPQLNLSVQTETAFFVDQGKQLGYMAQFGRVISFVMALGALAGALNTMYNSVADRAKEMATLRALGFSNLSAFSGTMVEALFLSVLGGLLGSAAAYLFFDGLTTSTLGGSFTQVVFTFQLEPDLFWQGTKLALLIGAVSGFFPAWRAARVPVALAFTANA